MFRFDAYTIKCQKQAQSVFQSHCSVVKSSHTVHKNCFNLASIFKMVEVIGLAGVAISTNVLTCIIAQLQFKLAS